MREDGMEKAVLVAGSGKMGALVATLLASKKGYQVFVADVHENTISNVNAVLLDVTDLKNLKSFVEKNGIKTVISCLPYFCNIQLAKNAKKCDLNYFDLTEDINIAKIIETLAKDSNNAFVPQCGVAPGFISIVANDLMQHFETIDSALLRVGALPEFPQNPLKYALTWSTDGLINEYGNPCLAIVNGEKVLLPPLEGLESIIIDGLYYEAFNTSGGLGTLVSSYLGKVNTINYKTLRYPGHCKLMRLLMNGLKLNQERETLKFILENAIPQTEQDVVIIYTAVNGFKDNQFVEKAYVKKIYPQIIEGKLWTAIQVATATSVCCVVDIVLNNPKQYQGMVLQESIPLTAFLHNPFGQYYR